VVVVLFAIVYAVSDYSCFVGFQQRHRQNLLKYLELQISRRYNAELQSFDDLVE